VMLQNTGAVISISFVMAIVTAAVPKTVLFAIFSGLAAGLSTERLAPFIHNMHTALWVLAAISLVGAGVSMLRPRHAEPAPARAGADARPAGAVAGGAANARRGRACTRRAAPGVGALRDGRAAARDPARLARAHRGAARAGRPAPLGPRGAGGGARREARP